MPTELRQETYLPEDDGREQAGKVLDFLVAHEAAGKQAIAPRYLLAGPEPGEQVEIPAEIYPVLRQVIEAMSRGLGVTVVPQSQTLTTQQAADVLGVSRPTLVRLLEKGRIPYDQVGTHRQVKLRNVLDYRERRREEQYRALEETAFPINDEGDFESVRASLREIRRRRSQQR